MKEENDDFLNDIALLANKAVRRAQQENRELGIPNVYSFRGTMIFELPDGTLTFENPFEQKNPPASANTASARIQDTDDR